MDKQVVLVSVRSPFEQNVPHLAELIFSYLSTNDIKQCRLVCKDWNNAASKLLWKRTEIAGFCQNDQQFLNLMKLVSSEECRFSFNFRNTGRREFSWMIPNFLLNPSVINFVAAVTLDIHGVHVILQLLTSLPNLKSLKAKIEVSRLPPPKGREKRMKPAPISRRFEGDVSRVQSLELDLVMTASYCPKSKKLACILETCANLKELVLRDETDCHKGLIKVEEIHKALPYPCTLKRLELCRWNPFKLIRPADFVSLTRFSNLQEINLLEWGQFSINKCLKIVAGNPLPLTWTSLKLNFHYDGIPENLLLPAMREAGLVFGSHLKHVVIRAKPKILRDDTKTWHEEWNMFEGILELTAAEAVCLCYRTDFLNLTSCKRLERLTWNVCWTTFPCVIPSTPSAVKHLTILLVLHDLEELDTKLLEKNVDFKKIPNLKTFTVKVLAPLQLGMGLNVRQEMDGIDFNFLG